MKVCGRNWLSCTEPPQAHWSTFRLKDVSFSTIHTNEEMLLIRRVRGLLRSGALKEEDKPIWYDVYTAFRPKYDRQPPDVPLRNIFYPEDTIRA
jgi:hypothetical protein